MKPIFVEHCYACHSADTKRAAGLRVDTSLGLRKGGHSGQILEVAKPEESLLLKRVLDPDPKHRMPKEGPPLSTAEIETLRQWIRSGAALPDETEKMPPMSAALQQRYDKLRHEHWAFQPITHPAIPAVRDTKWAEGNIDHFVLASMEAKGIAPVRDADPEVLLRRLQFELTGLEATQRKLRNFASTIRRAITRRSWTAY